MNQNERTVIESWDISVNYVAVSSASAPSQNPESGAEGEVHSQSTDLKADPVEHKQELPLELETKQSTLRLEAGVSDRLQTLCRENGICREVLIEALFEYAETNPKALNKVLIQAKEKNEYRQQIANRRRAKSMMEKFGG